MCPPHFSARFKGCAGAQRERTERWQEYRGVPCLEARTTNRLAGLILRKVEEAAVFSAHIACDDDHQAMVC